jgi:DNA recombination-dependent growth factor C
MARFPKNAVVYQFEPLNLTSEQLNEKLLKEKFTGCTYSDAYSAGFINPFPGSEDEDYLVHQISHYILLAVTEEKKTVPRGEFSKRVRATTVALEEKQGSPLTKVQKGAVEDEVRSKMLEVAFPSYATTYVYINIKTNTLFVAAGTSSKAETCLSLMRKALGSFRVIPVPFELDISATLSSWLRTKLATQETPEHFDFYDEVKFANKDKVSEGIVTFKYDDINSEAVRECAEEKAVQFARLSYQNGKILFNLDKSGQLKRIVFSSEYIGDQQENKVYDEDYEWHDPNVDFLITSEMMESFLADLLHAFAEEVDEEQEEDTDNG